MIKGKERKLITVQESLQLSLCPLQDNTSSRMFHECEDLLQEMYHGKSDCVLA